MQQKRKTATKEYITQAVLQLLSIQKGPDLLKDYSLHNLSISDVAKRAGVSRMAFYRNFDTLEQVLEEYYQPLIHEQFLLLQQKNDIKNRRDKQLDFFRTYKKDLSLAEKKGFEMIIRKIFTQEIASLYGYVEDRYLVTFIAEGTYAIWKKWLLNNQQEDLETVHNTLQKVSKLIDLP